MEWWGIEQSLLIRLTINILSCGGLLWLVYGKNSDKHTTLHAFFLFGMGVFFVTSLLHSVEMSMGFAFGLFAVFSMLRYRTESLSVKDMTYLFIIIALSLINAVSESSVSTLISIHMFIIMLVGSSNWYMSQSHNKEIRILYEEIENILPDRYPQLVQDLKKRTGLNILNVKILDIDFLKDTANLSVTYTEPSHAPQSDSVLMDTHSIHARNTKRTGEGAAAVEQPHERSNER